MSDLRELYQEVILDHYKKPRNHGKVAAASHQADGYNPLCGDKLSLSLELVDGVVKAIAFEGSGCAISTASASLMTEALKGKTRDEVQRVFDSFHALMTAPDASSVDTSQLKKLAVLAGVRDFPVRIKCATLAWHTLITALEQNADMATTE